LVVLVTLTTVLEVLDDDELEVEFDDAVEFDDGAGAGGGVGLGGGVLQLCPPWHVWFWPWP
jgi:hypothetical protein